jgi:hypothetical protein
MNPDYLEKKPNVLTRFLWWCAGADEYFLMKSPMQDRVKYAGIGGIVLATGALAGISGAYAFHTIFGPKGNAIDDSLLVSTSIKILTIVFGIIWGLIIFNFDRFIVSSTGKGDGTDNMTRHEFKNALPRIFIAIVLGFAISSPLEIKILESEINSELSIYQSKYVEDLNSQTDSVFLQKRKGLEKEKLEFENKFLQYEKELKTYSDQVDELVARQQSEMQDKRAYGFGPVAKKMQADIDTKRSERDKFISLKKDDLKSWRKQLDFVNNEINKLSEELRAVYKQNEIKSHGYDGLLKRIQISHEIGGIVPWVIFFVFLSIEMGPIFFKMMMTKGAYDFMVENYQEKKKVENGIFREDNIYEGVNGLIHAEKIRFLEVESAIVKAKAQEQFNKEVVGKWEKEKKEQLEQNPQKFYTEV